MTPARAAGGGGNSPQRRQLARGDGPAPGGHEKNGHPAPRAYDGSMVTKKKSALRQAQGERVDVVTEGAAQALLRRAPAKELSPEEEKVMRMRLGASPPRTARLERAGEGITDLEIEIQAAEIEAYMRWKAREQALTAPAAPRPQPSRSKEKIVRALRKLT